MIKKTNNYYSVLFFILFYCVEHLDALERGEMNESYDRRESYYFDDEEEEEEVIGQGMTSEEDDRVSDIEEESDNDSRVDKDDSPYQLITFGLDDLANLNDLGNDVNNIIIMQFIVYNKL